MSEKTLLLAIESAAVLMVDDFENFLGPLTHDQKRWIVGELVLFWASLEDHTHEREDGKKWVKVARDRLTCDVSSRFR